jgi:16S rRNA (adenine1518-N6/adenine1519-N6)-dimethyltransferase
VVSEEPRQASLRRLRRFDVRPNRELGQNFLIDDNMLEVIGRAAEPGPEDVVLEVGGGLGVLSEYLAARVGHLHVVEVDRALRAPLEDALAPFDNATLHLADALELDLTALDPPPGKVVANLPYGVAATVLLKSIFELPGARLWVAMVQREVAERLAAAPGSKTYGATSVLAQLACEVRLLRRIPRTVFHPEPNVDSALVLMRRRAPAPDDSVRALVHAGFAHRRKALSGSLALAAPAGPQRPPHARRPAGSAQPPPDRSAEPPPDRSAQPPPDLRSAVRAALVELGHPADARAERLAPGDWPRLAGLLGEERLAGLRPR